MASVDEELSEDFTAYKKASDMKLWNLYFSAWAAPSIAQENSNRFLKLVDEEPWDYAIAERIFPAAAKKQVTFRFRAPALPQGTACEIELQDQRHKRALRLRIDKVWLSFDVEKIHYDPVKIDPMVWNTVNLNVNCVKGTYTVTVNGNDIEGEIGLNDEPETIERILIRTGPFRGHVPPADVETGIAKQSGFYSEDLPAADVKAPKIVLHIDDLVTKGE